MPPKKAAAKGKAKGKGKDGKKGKPEDAAALGYVWPSLPPPPTGGSTFQQPISIAEALRGMQAEHSAPVARLRVCVGLASCCW